MIAFSIVEIVDEIMLFNFENTFLQIPQTLDLSVIAIIVISVTATILAAMVAITWKNIHQSTNTTYSQLLRGFHEDLTNRLNKNSIPKIARALNQSDKSPRGHTQFGLRILYSKITS